MPVQERLSLTRLLEIYGDYSYLLLSLYGSFHNKIKTSYLQRKKNQRVDTLVDLLLRMEHDFFIDRRRKLSEITLPKMQKTDADRHDRGSKIPCSDIEVCI